MRFFSPLLRNAVYPALHSVGFLGRLAPRTSYAVVNYHGVIPSDHTAGDSFLDGNLVRIPALRKQLQFLKAHYHIIHPEDFRSWIEDGKPLPPRAVLVTCDDGLINTLTDMLPVLQSESVPCLFFVTGQSCSEVPNMLWYEELYFLMGRIPLSDDLGLPTSQLETPAPGATLQARWWDAVRRASQLDANARSEWIDALRTKFGVAHRLGSDKRYRFLNSTELRRLAESGMSIGAHTVTHPVLCLCKEEDARREILDSKKLLEHTIGRTVWAFAYPFGDRATTGNREVALAREAGFACAFVNVEQWSDGVASPYSILRTHVNSNTTLPEYAAHVSGIHVRLQRSFRG